MGMSARTRTTLLLTLISALFFLPFLGGVHLFDWDEINFAEIAREMIVTGQYLEPQIHYEFFTEKPPMFMWLQALSMLIFGVGEYASRFPNALMGVVVIPFLYRLGYRLHGHRFGVFWALAFFGSILPHLYFKSGIIDPIFNFFIFLGILGLIRFHWTREQNDGKGTIKWLILAGVSTGIAVLVKGPVAYLITSIVLGVYFVIKRFRFFITIPQFLIYSIVVAGVTGIWFGLNYLSVGPTFITEFTIRQWELFSTPDAGHGGFPGYHFVVLLLGCFPVSVFALRGMFRVQDPQLKGGVRERDMRLWMLILFYVVLILFTIVKSKIVHYSSLAYYPLTYLGAWTVVRILDGSIKFKGWMKGLLIGIASLPILLTIVLPYFGKNIEQLRPLFSADPFAMENLNAEVQWTWDGSLAGLWLLGVMITFFLLLRNHPKRSFQTLFLGTGVWVTLTLVMYINKIESISQRAAIEFWQGLQGKEVYVHTYGYKSYAHLFYSSVMPVENEKYTDQEWLFHGDIDRPVYVSMKVTSRQRFEEENPDFEFLYDKNGFYFYVRKPALAN